MSEPLRVSTPADQQHANLIQRFMAVRAATELLCQPLQTEDYMLQTMADTSPPKWHLAHTTWFFETFLLQPHGNNYEVFHPQFGFLFNSYYVAVGARHIRPERGFLSRPCVDEVYTYRAAVDAAMLDLLNTAHLSVAVLELVELGLQHEQQHQELLLSDIKYSFYQNPLKPSYAAIPAPIKGPAVALAVNWHQQAAGVYRVGQGTQAKGFSFDNEGPEHAVYLDDYAIAKRCVSNAEYLRFINAGGYSNASLWLSDGWDLVQQKGWQAPLYWEMHDGAWQYFTVNGMQPVDLTAPVCHLSYYEADAYATWAGARLPTEAEWEVVARQQVSGGNFVEQGLLQPAYAEHGQWYGDVWEWTASAYAAYPGYRQPAGAIGEYNGKFMANQMVLKGGCCASPREHIRPSYRNFYYPHMRWQFAGLRLAK